jgi:hypothetical protein
MALIKQDKKITVRLRGGYKCKIGQDEFDGGELGKVITIPESEVKARPNLYENVNAPQAKKKEPVKKTQAELKKEEEKKSEPEPEKEPESESETEDKGIDRPFKDRMIRRKDTKRKKE